MAARLPTAILIVGMHRSGTSALAGLLGKLGVPLGDRLLAPGNDNPKGYWEHQDVVAIHERLLSRLGSRWDDVRALPEDWLESEAAREARTAIGDIIFRDFSGNLVWAVKDPRLCRVLPLWIKTLQEQHIRPVALFMVRQPSEVSASIEARNHWHPLVGKMLWLRYMTEAITASSLISREVILYDDLLVDPISSVSSAFAKLGIEVDSGVLGRQRKVIADFVDVAERHHADLAPENSSSVVELIAERLYGSLMAIAHGANRWKSANKIGLEFHREWQRIGACIDAVADMAARIEQDRALATIETCRLTSALSAQIRWSEQAQARVDTLQADKADLSSKLTAQLRWSDEAQARHEASQAKTAELTSKLTAQIRWSEEAQAKLDALQAEKTDLSSKLTAQLRWSDEAQARHEASQAKIAELTSKLTAQIRWSEEAQAARESLQADNTDLSSRLNAQVLRMEELQAKHEALAAELQKITRERDRIAADLEKAFAEKLALATELENVYASIPWRVTKPLRSVARLFKNNTGPTSSQTGKTQ